MSINTTSLIHSRRGRYLIYPAAAVVLIQTLAAHAFLLSAYNGFQLNDPLIPKAEIHHGGPPRDGIPAIDKPGFIKAGRVDYLQGEDRVLGIVRHGVAKAYPIKILNYHEIVNDDINAEPIVVTYCPLCGTGVAFSAVAAGEARSFGVSGLLYNSDVLLYDRQTESLWSQILGQAISGPLKGERLRRIALAHTTWADWRNRHGDTLVLSQHTGYRRDYSRDPYAGYENNGKIIFPVKRVDPRYHPKERVIGLEIDGRYKVYPFVELARTPAAVSDTFAGRSIRIVFDAKHRTGRVVDADGNEIPSIIAYWFAWIAFHPDTEVYRPAN